MIAGTLWLIAGVMWMIGSIWWFKSKLPIVGIGYIAIGTLNIGVGLQYLQ